MVKILEFPPSFPAKAILTSLLLTCCALVSSNVIASPLLKEITLDPDTDISITVYPASGSQRILWIPAYATPTETVKTVAAQLNKLGIEVWHADLLEARFFPKTASSIYRIRENDIISIVNAASNNRDRKLFIYTESRAVIPVLLSLRSLQQDSKKIGKFGGVIMNSPYFFVETPNPGETAELMPVTSVTNLPIYIFQPRNSPRYWQLKQTIPALEKSGSDVFIQVLKDIRGRFLFRPDSTPEEDTLTTKFGQLIHRAMQHLDTVNHKTRTAASENIKVIRDTAGKKERSLRTYQGNPNPPALALKNLAGKKIDLSNFSKQVVLVNFWASWCPPCVEEMPSMQRLSEKLPEKSFVILGVNIAEERKVVEKFLREKIAVEFPILLDTDGEIMRQWNVMAFPTSFVIDKKGKIRYALFGSIDWDTADIIKKLQALIDEPLL